MDRKIYIIIQGEQVKAYVNLKNLADNNPQVPYYTARRALLKFKTYKTNNYTIIIERLQYKTHRGWMK